MSRRPYTKRKSGKITPVVPPTTKTVKKRAKVLNLNQVAKTVATINAECYFALRDQVMLMLSHKAGLRAQEIAYLELEDVTDVQNRISDTLHVTQRASKGVKYGRARDVPLDADMKTLLREYRKEQEIERGPLFYTRYGKPMTPNAVEKQLGRIYKKAGFKGASSHSGRRTFITKGARMAGQVGCSLKDVQHLAGHASIMTTEMYIELSANQHKLTAMIGKQDAA